jgi:SAM-dependent methyltransferase
MPKYYIEEHETGYRRIKAEGKTHWSELHGQSGFDDFALRPLLEHMLPLLSFSVSHPRTLVYGCGTGPGACFLAARGFQVDGIDISPIAIDMAKQFAADRHLSIDYAVSDVCTLSTAGTRMDTLYDLIVDDFCLQCIVTDSDRANVFSAVGSRLKDSGYYLIGTAIFAEGRDYSDQVFDEETGTVYTKLEADANTFTDAVELSDGWYLPNRRHLKPEDLIKELEEAGFQTLWHHEEDSSMGLICQHTG